MSVNPRLPLCFERLNLPGNIPKTVPGLHLNPRSGEAGIRSPHHVPSAARKFLTGPNVRKTVVAPCALTLTPVGLTLIVCAITPGANIRIKKRPADSFCMITTKEPGYASLPACEASTEPGYASLPACEASTEPGYASLPACEAYTTWILIETSPAGSYARPSSNQYVFR